jgi:hypothetical protein
LSSAAPGLTFQPLEALSCLRFTIERLEMAAAVQTKKAGELSLARTTLALLRHYVGGRRGLIVLAVAATGIGLYLSWGWLAAAGIAPLLLALAPCAAMCALGLCASKMGSKSGSTNSSDKPPEDKPGA